MAINTRQQPWWKTAAYACAGLFFTGVVQANIVPAPLLDVDSFAETNPFYGDGTDLHIRATVWQIILDDAETSFQDIPDVAFALDATLDSVIPGGGFGDTFVYSGTLTVDGGAALDATFSGLQVIVSDLSGFGLGISAEIAGSLTQIGGSYTLTNPMLTMAVGFMPVGDLSTPFGNTPITPSVTGKIGTVPLPATLPLLLSAIAGFGYMGRRRRKH